MRKFLLISLLLLVLAVAAIAIVAYASGRPELMIVAAVPAFPFFPLLLIYLVVAAFAVTKQAHQGMADAAERLGFSYSMGDSESLRTEAAGFELMERRTRLSDVIRGEQTGLSICIFACHTEYDDGNGKQFHRDTVALLPGQTNGVPDFALRPETVLDRFSVALGGQDIDFEGSQVRDAFSRQFVLRSVGSANEQQVRDFFDEPLMEFFMKRKAVCLQVARNSLIVLQGPTFGRELARGLRSVRANVAEDAEAVLQQALDIHAALMERTHARRLS